MRVSEIEKQMQDDEDSEENERRMAEAIEYLLKKEDVLNIKIPFYAGFFAMLAYSAILCTASLWFLFGVVVSIIGFIITGVSDTKYLKRYRELEKEVHL